MTELGPASVEASVDIAADPAAVYALITDLPTLATLGRGGRRDEVAQGRRGGPGAVFKGRNSNGVRKWTTTCTVTDAEPGRAFAFDVKTFGVVPVAHWRYDIARRLTAAAASPSGPGTADPAGSASRPGSPPGCTTATGANAEHIKLTLQRLKAQGRSQLGPAGDLVGDDGDRRRASLGRGPHASPPAL